MRTIEQVIEELNKELFSIGEQVGKEIKSGKIKDTPYSRGMLQGIAMVAVNVENKSKEILEIHKAEQRPKGKWIYQEGHFPVMWKCSECRMMWGLHTDYCPVCGAKMETEE